MTMGRIDYGAGLPRWCNHFLACGLDSRRKTMARISSPATVLGYSVVPSSPAVRRLAASTGAQVVG